MELSSVMGKLELIFLHLTPVQTNRIKTAQYCRGMVATKIFEISKIPAVTKFQCSIWACAGDSDHWLDKPAMLVSVNSVKFFNLIYSYIHLRFTPFEYELLVYNCWGPELVVDTNPA